MNVELYRGSSSFFREKHFFAAGLRPAGVSAVSEVSASTLLLRLAGAGGIAGGTPFCQDCVCHGKSAWPVPGTSTAIPRLFSALWSCCEPGLDPTCCRNDFRELVFRSSFSLALVATCSARTYWRLQSNNTYRRSYRRVPRENPSYRGARRSCTLLSRK